MLSECALRAEWLETNGLGGYASSTVSGQNTRRYHGLLVAATKPPVGRAVLLSKFEETLVVNGERFELSVNQYPGVLHPRGDRFLVSFARDPFPVWRYQAGGVEIEKSLFLLDGENTVCVEYRLLSGAPCELVLDPLVAFRDYHSLTHENGDVQSQYDVAQGLVRFAAYVDLPELGVLHNGRAVEPGAGWYRNFEYSRELERGLDFQEDLFQPFRLRFLLTPERSARVIAGLGVAPNRTIADFDALREAEIARRRSIPAPIDVPAVRDLARAADQFLVRRGAGRTVIAGYHWFGDWGRDTMIALPGLAHVTRRFDVARGILRTFAENTSQGMLPNRFPDAGEAPEYNTVDAALWFFEAARSYSHHSGDIAFVRDELYPVLKDIIDWHVRGTRYGIGVDSDGLVRCGEPGVQLTWMDAKIGDWVVTPRHGKPVEIEALWYNALRVMESFAKSFDAGSAAGYRRRAAQAKASFAPLFWNEAAGCLYDVVAPGAPPDAALRPNQIFAVSLPHTMLSAAQAKQVVATVERELLTPMGLRTLARADAAYRPRYEGGVLERDSAYHQGPVWPWLMGPFLTAYLKVHRRSAKALRQAEAWLAPFVEHMQGPGLGQLPEIADAEAPHAAKGCIAQAWSVGELLRATVEDVYRVPGGRE